MAHLKLSSLPTRIVQMVCPLLPATVYFLEPPTNCISDVYLARTRLIVQHSMTFKNLLVFALGLMSCPLPPEVTMIITVLGGGGICLLLTRAQKDASVVGYSDWYTFQSCMHDENCTHAAPQATDLGCFDVYFYPVLSKVRTKGSTSLVSLLPIKIEKCKRTRIISSYARDA